MIFLYALIWWLAADGAENAPVQPIPFSHKTHTAAAQLKCQDCHSAADTGEVMTIPAAAKCMQCHQTIKSDSAAIQTLKSYADEKRPIPWVRVYEIPSYVFFSHKLHLDSGASCSECHGQVSERDRLYREVPLHMQDCMACHRSHKATVDCGACHEPKG